MLLCLGMDGEIGIAGQILLYEIVSLPVHGGSSP